MLEAVTWNRTPAPRLTDRFAGCRVMTGCARQLVAAQTNAAMVFVFICIRESRLSNTPRLKTKRDEKNFVIGSRGYASVVRLLCSRGKFRIATWPGPCGTVVAQPTYGS